MTISALVNIQLTAGATIAQANGAVQLASPQDTLNFSLQSTTGVQRWELTFSCPSFPALHGQTYIVNPGQQPNLISVPMPPGMPGNPNYVQGLRYTSTAYDGVQAIVSVSGFVQAKGYNTVPRQHTARAVYLASPGTYTNVNGVLTANANGAIGSPDGVTLAVGDLVLLPPGTPVGAAVDAGLYQVTSLGGASAKYVLTAAPDWAIGQQVNNGTEIRIEEGTVYAGVTWVVTNTGVSTVGTTSITFFPRSVTQSVTLVAGTVTISNVPLISATKSAAMAERTTANTSTATTGGYNTIGGKTTGALGTATFNFQACVAAGSINNADVSTLAVTVTNPC